ncbi:hypothetical protein TRIP_E300160 [uncultured Spirochaetota bacterium]|nr:hypothetical protein TRIP_E300160 [uncultured Spirochaetota bacterium]
MPGIGAPGGHVDGGEPRGYGEGAEKMAADGAPGFMDFLELLGLRFVQVGKGFRFPRLTAKTPGGEDGFDDAEAPKCADDGRPEKTGGDVEIYIP